MVLPVRSRGFALFAVTAALSSACATVPSSGPVHLSRPVPAVGGANDAPDVDVKALPPQWRPGLAPDAVVAGFLHALINSDSDYAIARSYLSDSAANTWDPSRGITTYDDSTLSIVPTTVRSSSVVRVRAVRIGQVNARGDYDPSPGAVSVNVTATRTGGQWRIQRLPDGVLLSAIDAQRALRLARVYYLSHDGKELVPEQTLLPAVRGGLATALVRTLLSGPGAWIAPAVTDTVPPGTTLIGNVPVDPSGVADVNLSGAVRQASTSALRALSAQIVWTLRQVSDIVAVRLLADGALLNLPGVPSRQRFTSWPQFDPLASVTPRGFAVVQNGSVVPQSGAPRALANLGSDVVSVALSGDGRTVAVVRRTRAGVVLATGPLGGRLDARVSARSFTAPTFLPSGDVVTVATNGNTQSVLEVLSNGSVRPVAVDPSLFTGTVQTLRVSRDGARVAAIAVAGRSGRLLVGRIASTRDALSFGAFHNTLPRAQDVRGIGWISGDELAVTIQSGRTRILVTTDVDGYAAHPVTSDALNEAPIDVTAAPGRALVVVTSVGDVWSEDDGWHEIGHGTFAAYPD